MTDEVNSSVEKTEVIYGAENVLNWALQAFSRIKERLDQCTDSKGPSTLLAPEEARNALIELNKRGVRMRFITDINKYNISYCKGLMKIAELRHLEGLKGNFGISDGAIYGGSANTQEGEVPKQLIVSNVKAFVAQQQYFFETLWNKAIPAEERIREIEEGIMPYQTRILQNRDEIVKEITHLAETSSGVSVVSTFGGMQLAYNNFFDLCKKILDNYRKGKGKGIKWVCTLDRDSADLVKMFLNLGMEVRHVKNIYPLNFAIGDRELNATIEKMEGGKMVQSLLASSEPTYVNHFRSIFEELWRSGIDAKERIRAIEEGIDIEGIEIIQNPYEVQKLAWELIKLAQNEILIMLSTSNAFRRQERVGTIELLKEAAKLGVKIRILMPIDDLAKDPAQKLVQQQIEMRNIREPLQSKVNVLLVDRKHLLTAETRDDSRETSYESVGLSTYSNSKPTVLSYASIFESLWIQSELYEQLKVHDTMQKDFINVAAHELRTPIQPILSSAELLHSKIVHVEQRELLDVMTRNAKRLQRLVESILDVTKIESGLLTLKKEPFNLNDVVLGVILDYENQIKKDNIKLVYESNEDIFVEADRYRLTQVISNLLSNAIKFTKEGIVSVTAKKENKSYGIPVIVVSIKDTGQGIDPEILPRLFSKFVTKSDVGTGLGLFISKSIIEAHGGKIRAENNANGKGATFTFTLPVGNSEHV